jgi:hypothetical protein
MEAELTLPEEKSSGPARFGVEVNMACDDRNLLQILKEELAFLEQGGYGRSVRTPWKPTVTFLDSPICINFGEPERPHRCEECHLIDFVPEDKRSELNPCHFIPLNESGETISQLYNWGSQEELEESLGRWLRERIAELESRHAKKITG